MSKTKISDIKSMRFYNKKTFAAKALKLNVC